MTQSTDDTILRYAEDGDFVRWVKSGFQHNNSHWQNERASSDNPAALDAAIELVSALEFNTKPSENRKDLLFDRILSDLEPDKNQEPVRPRRRTLRIWPLAVAASLALLLYFFFPGTGVQSVRTGLAESQQVQLPDNSKVTLNAESEIEYNTRVFKEGRVLTLQGEAFFDVEPGSRFEVRTGQGSVEVLGTTFNVYTRQDRMEVYCATGKVLVKSSSGLTFCLLEAGESCVVDNGELSAGMKAIDGEWRSGMFSYEDREVSFVAEEIERQFNIELLLPDSLQARRYTGFFENDNLERALNSVFWPLGLEYKRQADNRIVISEKQGDF